MKLSSCFLLLVACGGSPAAAVVAPVVTPAAPAPPAVVAERFPASPRGDVVDDWHGVAVADPYRWLEDRKSPETQAWMAAQDQRTRTALAALPARSGLAAELAALFMVDSVEPPVQEAGRWFYEKQHAEKDKQVVYMRAGARGADAVLFDPNTMSDDGSVTLAGWSVSPTGRYVAYRISRNNSDMATLRIRDLKTGQDLPDVIEGARYAYPAWLPKDAGFYYVALPVDAGIAEADLPAHRSVRLHKLGTAASADLTVVPEIGDASTWMTVDVSADGHWLVTAQTTSTNSDVWFKDLRKKLVPVSAGTAWSREAAGFVPLAVGSKAQHKVHVWKDRFYVHSNEGASRWRIFVVDPRKPARASWKELVAERADATLRAVDVHGGQLVLHWLRNVQSELEIRRLDGKLVKQVALPGVGSIGQVSGDGSEREVYFEFSSFVTPKKVYELDVRSGQLSLWQDVKLTLDLSDVETSQVEVTSKDGTKLPMFLVHRKGLKRDGSNPVYLHGYGGFDIVKAPEFMPGAAVFVAHGGVFALPSLRGGGELGEAWHRAGMLESKQNVFDDFIASAEWLVNEKITSAERIAIWGRSNGGLLVGAAMTQRPDLFKAVVCTVPLLDMVRFHLSGAGATWTDEYGSAADAAQFKWLHAYSPYHRVVKGTKYPALLMESSDHDDRVEPLHARKFVAAIQWATGGDAPVWLRIERQAGHAGADSLKQKVDMWADHFAFVFDQLGME